MSSPFTAIMSISIRVPCINCTFSVGKPQYVCIYFHWLSKTFQEFVSYIGFAKNKVPILVCSFGSPILTLLGDVIYGWSLEQTNALLNNLLSRQLKTSFERLNGLKSKLITFTQVTFFNTLTSFIVKS